MSLIVQDPLRLADQPQPGTDFRAEVPGWLADLARSEGAGKPMGYLARHSRSFRFAARFLPKREAAEVAEVYAFCRFTDDIVDGSHGSALPPEALEARLEDWLRLARMAHAGTATGLPLLGSITSRKYKSVKATIAPSPWRSTDVIAPSVIPKLL